MSKLAFWDAPLDSSTERIEVWSSLTSDPASMTLLVSLAAKDPYGNWITHYHDTNGHGHLYYQARFFDSAGASTGLFPVGIGKRGADPLGVLPQEVLDTIQGVPQNFIKAELVQRYITAYIRSFEYYTNIKLSETTATQERYGVKVYQKILGDRMGQPFNLRHFPVIGVDKIEYQVRGASVNGPGTPEELQALDVQVEFDDPASGYNRGMVSVFVASADIQALFALLNYRHYRQNRVQILITYRHGFAVIPVDVAQAIIEMSAASILEIQGEAETGGLASRSIDGYSESFTASATTTQFSARRIWYEKGFKELLERYKKPLWG